MTPEQTAEFATAIKGMNSSQQSQMTAVLAAQAVANAMVKGILSHEQSLDILKAAAFACHVLSTHATLETLVNSATSHDAPPIEVVLAQFMINTHNEVRPALDKLQNLLDMIKETP